MRNNKISIKNISIMFVTIVLTIVTYLLYFQEIIGTQHELKVAGALYIVGFLIGLIIIKIKTGTYASLMTFFWVSFFLFHGSQVVLKIFGMGNYKSFDLFDFYSMSSIIKATYYSTICELMFCFGILLNRKMSSKKRYVSYNNYITVIKDFSKILLLVSAVPFAFYIILVLRTGVTEGYGAINDYSNYGNARMMKILLIFVDMFIIGAFFLMISSYKKKTVYYPIVAVILLYCLVLLALGERTEPTSLIVLILWIDNYLCLMSGNVSGARRKRIVAGTVLGILILVFPSIMALRHNGIITVSALVSNIRRNGVWESVQESIAGLGYSMLPLIEVRRFVENGEPLRYGLTYLASLTNVVPGLGFAKANANLATWLMQKMHLGYGPGFSMAAEAYLNFKNFPFPMIIFGYLISKILMWKNNEIDLRKLIRGMAFVITCLTLPRRELCGRVRDIAYLVILLPLVIDFVYQKRQKKSKQY